MISEDIEPDDHTIARNIAQDIMQQNGYDVTPGCYLEQKSAIGNPNKSVIPPDFKDHYYKEFDLRCKKYLDNGLTEEIFIEIGNEDDWDTRHSSANSSKYVYHKQLGNDKDAEDRLHILLPDAIVIRPSKGEILTIGDNQELFHYFKNLSRKYINDFIQEQSSTKF